jgi:hypothetical protein
VDGPERADEYAAIAYLKDRDEECQPDEAEAVQDEQRPQRFHPWPEAEFRPDISSGDDPPRDEAECDALTINGS